MEDETDIADCEESFLLPQFHYDIANCGRVNSLAPFLLVSLIQIRSYMTSYI
jgi:hypothetical protein